MLHYNPKDPKGTLNTLCQRQYGTNFRLDDYFGDDQHPRKLSWTSTISLPQNPPHWYGTIIGRSSIDQHYSKKVDAQTAACADACEQFIQMNLLAPPKTSRSSPPSSPPSQLLTPGQLEKVGTKWLVYSDAHEAEVYDSIDDALKELRNLLLDNNSTKATVRKIPLNSIY